MSSFQSFGLADPLLKAIDDLGFTDPTPIQTKAVPILLSNNRDFIGLAQTGTGKTAAFALPLLHRIFPEAKDLQGLILAPTRELAQQIAKQLDDLSKHVKGLNVLTVYGGASIQNQIKALQKPRQIIVATPGRLIDLMRRKKVHLNSVQFLIRTANCCDKHDSKHQSC